MACGTFPVGKQLYVCLSFFGEVTYVQGREVFDKCVDKASLWGIIADPKVKLFYI